MLAQLVAIALAVDAGLPDAGFEPVVLDVYRGELWLNEADGGISDAPLQVRGGVWMDDETTMYTAKEKARSRGAASVGPEVDTKTLTIVGAVMFAIGVGVGGALVYALVRR